MTLRACAGLSIYRGRLALYVINNLHRHYDIKIASRLCAWYSQFCFVLFSSQNLKCRSFPSHFFCSSLPFLHLTLGLSPLPEISTSLSWRCPFCSSPSESSSHSCLRLQLLTRPDVRLVLGTPCMGAADSDRCMENSSWVTPP